MRQSMIDRRQFLRYISYGGIFVAGQQILSACRPFLTDGPISESESDPDVEVRLVARPEFQQIYPGTPTNIWRYQGEVIKGSSDSLMSLPGSYLGPIFKVKTGTHLRVNFVNELPEKSIIHWHGLHVPDSADGHHRFAIESGETYQYDFQVMDRAGTYWYHPHPHGRTGPQVYQGLAGLFLIHDDQETALGLPSQGKDLPIVIQDRVFDGDNQFVYEPFLLGMFGDKILVNGLPDFKMEVERSAYRLRLMNGSNARIYKLAWSDGTPLQVIGTEGGLLEKPLSRDYVTLAPAQRIEIWVDFGVWEPGKEISMISLPSAAPDSAQEIPIFTAIIQSTGREPASVPEVFPAHKTLDVTQAVNENAPRVFELSMGMGMRWLINGRTFEMTDVTKDEKVRLGDVEIWEFQNPGNTGMGMMAGMTQPHPMHIHGLQFKILNRQIEPGNEGEYDSLKDGFVDDGWHDTVLVMPGERVKIVLRFEDYSGLYLYHCHNLEHEDMGMMRNYQIEG